MCTQTSTRMITTHEVLDRVIKMKEKPEILQGMSEENRTQYLKRLELETGSLPDPFSMAEAAWSRDSYDKWPPLKVKAIKVYFVDQPSEYTHQATRAYRSLFEGYNYFVSDGHIQDCFFSEFGDYCFLRSMMLPGQQIEHWLIQTILSLRL